MAGMHLKRFFVSIVFPSILAIVFFVMLIFLVIIPSFEKNIMEGKKETIYELTNSARSLIYEYYQEVQSGSIELDSARILAAERIRQIRYGDEGKDYFWIIDKQPKMIMHPYRAELVGKSLTDYRDPEGTLLFVEAVNVVAEKGEGYIDYMWQWKDDSTRIVPKLSYVQEFEPWGWIIGTGIYLEDVRAEIRTLKNRLLGITLFFTLLIAAILAFIIRQSLIIERQRTLAESRLRLSRQKYKSLVEASTEGTLMLMGDKIIFSNEKFSRLSGYEVGKVREMRFGQIFDLNWQNLQHLFTDPRQSVSRETILRCKDGQKKEVVLSASMVSNGGNTGYILIVKEVSTRDQLERETELLSRELRASLQLMNQPVQPWIKRMVKCQSDKTIKDAADLMVRRGVDVLFIQQEEAVIGVINSNDLKNRVVAQSKDSSLSVMEIMTSPVETVRENARLYEVMVKLNSRGISHLATLDAEGNFSGVIGYKELYAMQQNTISFMLREIESAADVDQLARIYKRVPVLVKALLESGDQSPEINRIISTVADAIHKKVIELAVENHGEPPCRFAFMVMGSEGRGEQSLATDQDNAIVYEEVGAESVDQVKAYFIRFAAQINRDLNTVGYKYCKGEVMANNPKWTQSIDNWKAYFTKWINNSTPVDVLEAAIFFDFRYVYGDQMLVDHLRDHVHKVSENKAVFYYHLSQTVLKFKPPMNIFGKIVGKEAGPDELSFDIKKAMFPIVAFIRLYAIQHNCIETNSMDRLEKLHASNVINASIFESIKQSYDLMMRLRLRFQVSLISQNEPPGNMIDLNSLSKDEVGQLKKAFSTVSDLQSQVGFDFKG